MTLLDTNVVIELLKRKAETQTELLSLTPPFAISAITLMELIHGAHNNQEVTAIEHYLRRFELLHVSQSISNRALELMRHYAKSHSLELTDSLIAATAIEQQRPLFTYNRKDFRFIHDLHITP